MVENAVVSNFNTNNIEVDKRVRIRAKPGQEERLYGRRGEAFSTPMWILHITNGIIFPYTPSLSFSHTGIWSSQDLVHNIQQWYYFGGNTSPTITVTGTFTAQTRFEAAYVFAVFHFLRSYSKIQFGERTPDELRGLPPPTVLFDAYGNFMFNSLPVIIKSWSFDFPSDVDYVKVPISVLSSSIDQNTNNVDFSNISLNTKKGVAYVPSVNTVSMELVVQQPLRKLRREFNLGDFVEGRLLGTKKGFT